MSNTNILNLPAVTGLTGTEYAPVVQDGTTKRAKVSQFDLTGTTPGSAQDANTVLAGPTSGSPDFPAFRALVNADLPTVDVEHGGSGRTSATAYAVLCGGATSTGAHQSVASVGTTGQALLSNGASALPTFQTLSSAIGAALTRVDDTNVTLTLGGAPTTALLSATSITAGWSGQLSIARGGTGQATATAAFDALAPTTTRGDLIARGASSNGRLAIGTSGYLLGSDGTDPSWVAFIQSGTGAASRTWSAKVREVQVSVNDFTGNFTTALTAALATGATTVFIPPGTYSLTAGVTISTTGQRIIGGGVSATTIESTASGHSITIADTVTGASVQELTLTRTGGAAIAGQNGIHCASLAESALIQNVTITNHYVGLRLGITSFSKVIGVICDNNYSHGINITNASGAGGMQWTLVNCLSQRNNGYGLLWEAVTATASVGEVLNFSTFANALGGAWFLGQAAGPIRLQAIRWLGGFIGEDGNHGIYLDTYNTSTHKIEGVFSELAGVSAVGRNQGTPATNTGDGIRITANQTSVVVDDVVTIFNSYNGIKSAADRILIVGAESRLNGAAASAGNRNGIHITAGQATIVGNACKANFIGITVDNDDHVIVGNDVTENTSAAMSLPAISTSIIAENKGATINYLKNPRTFTLGGSAVARLGATSNYNVFSLVDSIALNGTLGMFGGASGDANTLYLAAPAALSMYFGGVDIHAFTLAAARILQATAIPAGGTAGTGILLSSTANFGAFFGSGAPTLSAAQGSLYLRSNGSGMGDRMYVNTDGSTTWAPVTTGLGTSTNAPQQIIRVSGVNCNSANTDNAISMVLPTGFTRYRVAGVVISGASASLTTATFGLYTSTGGGGTAIVAGATAITVNTASEDTNNNMQIVTIATVNTQSFTTTPLYFRVETPQGSAATGNVSIFIQAVS